MASPSLLRKHAFPTSQDCPLSRGQGRKAQAAMPLGRLCLALLLPALLLGLALPGPARAADAGPSGYIDWERQVAVGVGTAPVRLGSMGATQARAMAQRAAMLDARRNLLEVVGQVRVDSASVVQNFMTVSDRVTTTVQGLLAGATVAAERLLPGGTYEVTLTVPLSGPLTQELLAAGRPAPLPRSAPEPPAAAAPVQAKAPDPADRPAPQNTTMPQQAPAPAPAEPAPAAPPAPEPAPAAPVAAVPAGAIPAGLVQAFTGLVVDARGTGFAPSLKPAFMAGKEQLYPGPAVDQAVAVRRGLVRYYRDLGKAQQSREVGASPKTVKAAAGSPGALDLAPDDAALLRAVLAQPGNFLDQCKVVVVF